MLKLTRLLNISIFLPLLCGAPLYAAAAPGTCATDDVHCAYTTGTPSDGGRYVKVQVVGVGTIPPSCYDNSNGLSLTQSDVPKYGIGQKELIFSMCTDVVGSNCTVIGDDKFTISKNGNLYSAVPQFYDLNLAPFAGKYPPCDASLKTAKQHL